MARRSSSDPSTYERQRQQRQQQRQRAPTTTASSGSRGPVRRDEYVRRVREALATDYAALHTSPLCALPGVAALAHTQFAHRIFPEAAALRALLDRACARTL